MASRKSEKVTPISPYVLRVLLIENIPAHGRGKTSPTEKVIDVMEVDVDNHAEGVELVEEVGGFLEEEFQKELFDCE